MSLKLVAVLCLLALANGQKDPHVWPGRSAIVHLFEWKFVDVAAECERFLAPKGYAGVQLSPVRENLIIPTRPWWERYQPISYKIITRSGDEAAFRDMTRRCNDVGIRIYIDVTPNHMSTSQADALPAVGTGGSTADPVNKYFPEVPYSAENFHDTCQLYDWDDLFTVRHCELNGLRDLDQGQDYVRGKLIEYFNHLIELGVAGFRVDAASLMCPKDIYYLFNTVNNLNTDYGFAPGSRPFVYQEVVDYGVGGMAGITKYDYSSYARVTEFKYGMDLSMAFRGNNPLKNLQTFGVEWGFMPSGDGLVFIDNHDTQRHEENILTYKNDKMYKMAVSFMLAWPHGYPRVMSSYYFSDTEIGPPADSNQNTISPSINPDDTCGNGWVCEHRWSQIYGMVGFRNAVDGTEVTQWWDNGNKQIAFCRGGKGFIAYNDFDGDLQQNLQTCLPAGRYCDVATGRIVDGTCTGKVVEVGADGRANIEIANDAYDGFLAIHINASLGRAAVHPKLTVSAKDTTGASQKAVNDSPVERDDPVFPDCP